MAREQVERAGPLVQVRAPRRVGGGGERLVEQAYGVVAPAHHVGRLGGVLEQVEPVHPEALDVLGGHLVEQVEGAPEAGVRVREGIHPLRGVPRPHRRGEGPRQVARLVPVPRGLPGGVRGGQRLGRRTVQPRPLGGQQAGVDDLAQRRVPEADGVVGQQLEDVLVERRAEQLLDGLLVLAQGRRQQRHRRRAADDRCSPQHPVALRRQSGRARLEQPGERGGQALAAALEDEVLDEQRVPGRALGDRLEHPRRGRAAEQVGDQPRGVLRAEAVEVDRPRQRQPGQLGEPAGQLGALGHLVVAVGQHDQHPLAGEVGREVAQQVERRPVRPLQVLHHVHHGAVAGQPVEQGEHALEQPQR